MARFDLQLDGLEAQLYFANDAVDAKRQYRHVIFSVLNEPNASARFTTSRDGRLVYGVLRTETYTYVFESTGSDGEQAVYRYPKVSALDDGRRGIIGKSPIARRHHQLETVAEVRPTYSFSDDHSAYVIGGELGTTRSITPAAFVRGAIRDASQSAVNLSAAGYRDYTKRSGGTLRSQRHRVTARITSQAAVRVQS
ncbi:MAG TPA: hypothetical protein VNR40_11965 [Steroidobacter sp.]|nr:hypothetical protein [Steroidobacter sp.]